MRKFIVLLLIMFPFISSVQAQNCQIRPSCAELGYTKTVELCEGQAYLTCPFDESQVYCPFDCEPKDCSGYGLDSCPDNATCESCDIGCEQGNKYKVTKCQLGYYWQNGVCTKIDGVIGMRYNVTAVNGVVKLITGKPGYASGKFTVDWGDGTVESYHGATSVSHTYTETGDFDIILSGTIKHFLTSTSTYANITHLLSLNLPSVTSYADAFSSKSTIISTIPALPTNLQYASNMFYYCSGLTGNIPVLPPTLTNGTSMFNGCSGLTGSIPELPSGLERSNSMFRDCSSLTGNIPELPPGLTDGGYMFLNCSGLTGNIPELPSGLTSGYSMFRSCSSLTGNIPELPSRLTNGGYMFYGCSSLTGNIPKLPLGLTDGGYMFYGCSSLTGNIPKLPSELKKAEWMFYGCTGLNGTTPAIPYLFDATTCGDILGECQLTFGHTQITNDGSWPDGAW